MIAVTRIPRFTIYELYELAERQCRFSTAKPPISNHKPCGVVLVEYPYGVRCHVTRRKVAAMLWRARNNKGVV